MRNTSDRTLSNFTCIAVGSLLKLFLVMAVIDMLGISVISFAAFLAAFGIGFGNRLV